MISLSNILGPRAILTETSANFHLHCCVPIGAYCKVHNNAESSNTETQRVSPVIALTATVNSQGSYHLFLFYWTLDAGSLIVDGTNYPSHQDHYELHPTHIQHPTLSLQIQSLPRQESNE